MRGTGCGTGEGEDMLDFVCAGFKVPTRHLRSDVQKAVEADDSWWDGRLEGGGIEQKGKRTHGHGQQYGDCWGERV